MTWKEQYDTREAIRIEAEEKARAEYRAMVATKKETITDMIKTLDYLTERINNGFFYSGITVFSLEEKIRKLHFYKLLSVIDTKSALKQVKLISWFIKDKNGFVHIALDNFRKLISTI